MLRLFGENDCIKIYADFILITVSKKYQYTGRNWEIPQRSCGLYHYHG